MATVLGADQLHPNCISPMSLKYLNETAEAQTNMQRFSRHIASLPCNALRHYTTLILLGFFTIINISVKQLSKVGVPAEKAVSMALISWFPIFQDIDEGTGSNKLSNVRKSGKCKWFNVVKGYGFITPNDGSPDVFLHQTVIQMQGFRSLAEGEDVEFECKETDKGFEATFVCGPCGSDCKGSEKRPVSKKKFKKLRCYNCGEFTNHVAAKCPKGPMPKRCHQCRSDDHLIADCPLRKSGEASGKQTTGSTSSSSKDSTGSSGAVVSIQQQTTTTSS